MNPSQHDTDHTRIIALRTGDVATFEAIFRELYDELLRFTIALVDNESIAEDLVDDVLGDLWIRRVTLDVRDTLRAYLFGAVRNRAMSLQRHDMITDRAHQLAWPQLARLTGAPSVLSDAAILDTELATAVAHAISVLPPRAREAFMLKHDQELTYSEIAAIMNISVKTVELHIARAFRGLRAMLWQFRTRG